MFFFCLAVQIISVPLAGALPRYVPTILQQLRGSLTDHALGGWEPTHEPFRPLMPNNADISGDGAAFSLSPRFASAGKCLARLRQASLDIARFNLGREFVIPLVRGMADLIVDFMGRVESHRKTLEISMGGQGAKLFFHQCIALNTLDFCLVELNSLPAFVGHLQLQHLRQMDSTRLCNPDIVDVSTQQAQASSVVHRSIGACTATILSELRPPLLVRNHPLPTTA